MFIIKSKTSVSVMLFVSMVSLLLFAIACSGEDSVETVTETVEVEKIVQVAGETVTVTETIEVEKIVRVLEGTVEIDGSSTVYPISEAVAEEFNKVYPDVRVNVGVSGTGGGFKRFNIGETDISDASRPIKDPKETSVAAENGINYVELRLGTDGLSVVVSKENDFVDCLTTDELKAIWEPGSTMDNWSEVRAGFPDQKMRLYGPDTDSGTFDYFTEEIMGEAQLSRADYTASADDNVLVQGIAGDKGSLGYFGYAYYQENTEKLKLVAVDSGSGCVKPSSTTIPSGEYSPLSRPLFIYVNTDSYNNKPAVKELVDFYMINGPKLTNEVGYVASDSSVYDNNKALLKKSAEPKVLEGTVEIDGSSTVYPISEAVAEEFNKVYPDVRVNVGVSGTGGGFKRFNIGETDISDASRPIKDPKETSVAAENGINYVELRLGTDGLSVVVSKENDFVDCLTTDELKAIWEPGSTMDNWSEVRAGFPDQKMRLYGPDTDSGTFDYFTEEIMGEAQLSRADYTASADDNVLVQGIAGDKGSLGYFGYAYYQENTEKLKLVAVDSGSGCVKPSSTTIPSGEYSPLSRPLFIYVNTDSYNNKPAVKELVDFYMINGPKLTNEVGYVASDSSVYDNNKALLKK